MKEDGRVVIAIVADDKELQKGLNTTERSIESLETELSRVNNLLKLDPTNVELLKQKQELLTKEVTATGEKLNLLREAQRSAQEQFDKGEITEEQYRSLTREIEATQISLNALTDEAEQMTDAFQDANGSAEKFAESTDAGAQSIGELSDSSESAEENLNAMHVALAATSAALIAAGTAAVKVSTQFDAAFAKTQTIMDTTSTSAAEMRNDVLELSRTSTMAASDVSEAVYQAISGSVDTADAAGFVNDANRLAVAGFTSLSNATDVLTTTLNSYGLEASAVSGISNVLIQTQNLGKTSVDELAGSMGRAISTGSAYGVNLENLATAYVELTRGGIETAIATTYLSGMLNELGDSGSKAGSILQQETGKSFGQLMADGWSLGDVLQVLSDSVNGNAEALMGLWSSQEAGKASNAILTQGIEDFNGVLAQMQQEMQGATGTTAAAYMTMTNTSAFIDNRLSNSVDNLGIAFGDQLRPALDNVKQNLSSFVEGLTGFVKENPWAVSAVTALSTAVVVLAAGYGALLIAKNVAKAVRSLNDAMISNPAILLASALAALVVGIGSFAAAASGGCEAANALNNAIEESESTYRDSMASIEGNAELARRYADRLQELEAQERLTAEEAEEYRITVEELREIMPELNLQIDEQTGMLKEGAAALDAQIDGWYELAVAQALQERYKEEIAAMAEAEADRTENLARQSMLQQEITANEEKTATVEQKIADIDKKRNQLQEEYNRMEAIGDTETYDFGAAAEQIAQYEEELNGLQDTRGELIDQHADLRDDMDDLKDDEEDLTEAIEANRDAVENAAQAVDFYNDSIQHSGTRNQRSRAEVMGLSQEFMTAAETLGVAYNEAYEAARSSIDSQIGLFQNFGDTMTEINGMTVASAQSAVDGLIGSLDSQISYMNEYATNMQLAAERGISQGLLQQLSDGSEQSAMLLAELVNATDGQIQELNEKFAGVEEGKENFSGAMAEYSSTVEDEKDTMVRLAAEAGIDMSDKLTSEMLAGLPDFQRAVLAYSRAVDDRGEIVYKPSGGVGYAAYATGTASAAAGYALVGEEGPELVLFHGGEQVLTAEETKQTLASVYPRAPQMAMTGSGAPAIAGRGTITLRATIVTPVTVDGREVARATAQYMGEQMEFEVM